jgi:hypothetical protein
MKSQVFTVVPASNAPLLFMGAIALLLVLMAALFIWIAMSTRSAQVTVSGEGLKIAGGMYGRSIPAASLIVDEAKVLHLGRDRDYQMKWRTNGVGLPGYASGWFKLRNGEKSLCYVTDQKRIVYIPTTDGYSVMLSVERPEEFKTALAAIGR